MKKRIGLKFIFFAVVKPEFTYFRTLLFMYALSDPQINLRSWFQESII